MTDEEIYEVQQLIDELNATACLDSAKRERLKAARDFDFIEHMDLSEEDLRKAYDDHASQWRSRLFDTLSGPIETRHLAIRQNDQNMIWQVMMIKRGMSDWFERAYPMPPAYADRIATLLRKVKAYELERAFLAAYLRHFRAPMTVGVDGKLIMRAQALGI